MRQLSMLTILTASLCLAAMPVSGAAISMQDLDADAVPTSRNTTDGSEQLFDVKFGGGSVYEYLNTVKDASPVSFNFQSTIPQHANLTLRPVTLKAVDLETAVQFLDDVEPADESFELEVEYFPATTSTIAVVNVHTKKHRDARQQRTQPLFSNVWSLATLTQSMEPEQILNVIELAIELEESETQPKLRFHNETQLLIARAPRETISVIDRIIETLEVSQQRARQIDEKSVSNRLQDLESAYAAAQNTIKEQRAALDDARREQAHFMARMEAIEIELHRAREMNEQLADQNHALTEAVRQLQNKRQSKPQFQRDNSDSEDD